MNPSDLSEVREAIRQARGNDMAEDIARTARVCPACGLAKPHTHTADDGHDNVGMVVCWGCFRTDLGEVYAFKYCGTDLVPWLNEYVPALDALRRQVEAGQ